MPKFKKTRANYFLKFRKHFDFSTDNVCEQAKAIQKFDNRRKEK